MATDETSPSILSMLADWAVSLMDIIGPPGAGIAIALENIFPPLPSEVILPLAGLAASRGSFTLAEALIWTTAGSVVGAFLLYTLGALLGADRLRRAAEWLPLVRGSDVDKSVAWFDKHGGAAVFFGRMLPIFRSLISIPAGITRMNPVKFGLYTLAGSLIWNSIFVLSGFFLGEQWHIVEQYAEILQWIVIVGIVGVIAWFVIARVRDIRRHKDDPTPQER
ncbi:membrane protein DedA with SNARE-associated domain [Microbacteriaceae bacterium SG_E_30_P1]|uniref:Membrane protein DedA with SNARE-associated domain n=1 Tax=Antiquaquibacter oligotrophicus TaxID=2880260 RepID=A0ABT6KIT3_9MICO|nr:DedA family protein [Antiquaquibacter oligotrophicus]MDH6179850.1 membrane protein DedA with SNARE-associated domain [Antiquaquibacter oligotrophicus]UDF14389.1 DedA family protein [Antiquaquibacter oligotrophicus]